MPGLWPIVCDTSISSGTTAGTLTAVSGYSLTVPSDKPNGMPKLIGHDITSATIYESEIHNTALKGQDPQLIGPGNEADGANHSSFWYPPIELTPQSNMIVRARVVTTEDVNACLWLLQEGAPYRTIPLGRNTRNPYSIYDMPGRFRILKTTGTTVADVFTDMTAFAGTDLKGDCDYILLGAMAHGATATGCRFVRAMSNDWSQGFAPVWPVKQNTNVSNILQCMQPLSYIHSGGNNLFLQIYSSAAEACKAYLALLEIPRGR